MRTDSSVLALLDTNVLVYAEQRRQPQHEAAKLLRDRALTGELSACTCPQVLSEFFAVVTRFGDVRLSSQEATDQVKKYHRSKRLVKIYPGRNIVERMLELLETHPVTGLDIHDLRLVATMLENGVTRIYTFNVRDFAPFSEIEVLTPPEPTLAL